MHKIKLKCVQKAKGRRKRRRRRRRGSGERKEREKRGRNGGAGKRPGIGHDAYDGIGMSVVARTLLVVGVSWVASNTANKMKVWS